MTCTTASKAASKSMRKVGRVVGGLGPAMLASLQRQPEAGPGPTAASVGPPGGAMAGQVEEELGRGPAMGGAEQLAVARAALAQRQVEDGEWRLKGESFPCPTSSCCQARPTFSMRLRCMLNGCGVKNIAQWHENVEQFHLACLLQ